MDHRDIRLPAENRDERQQQSDGGRPEVLSEQALGDPCHKQRDAGGAEQVSGAPEQRRQDAGTRIGPGVTENKQDRHEGERDLCEAQVGQENDQEVQRHREDRREGIGVRQVPPQEGIT